ncbi:MAG: CDP-diacylglycerol--serine O-phosphatidyltransferase [Deltaproteobacteria bacterium]|nr:CDP-diacylglycerol--serine O-phosphatidyltransferase [Deltaproteobacteria bacterium]
MNLRESKRRRGLRRSVFLLPSMCTTASLFCGFFSVLQSLSGDYIQAAWFILFAGVFDLLDGRLARLAKAESEFGIQYDSLVDLCSFGFAPSILIYTWSLQSLGRLGAMAAFLFFACGALRLARFNVQHSSVEGRFFQGLPIPSAAYLLTTLVLFYHSFAGMPPQKNIPLAVLVMALSLLMVSSINYRSMKAIQWHRRNSFFALVSAVIVLFVIASDPDVMMFVFTLAYVASGPLEELITFRQSKRLVAKVRAHRKERREEKRLKVVGGRDL